MNKQDKLNAIEKLWKSKQRSEYVDGDITWEQIQWEPFAIKGRPYEYVEFPGVHKEITEVGHFMYIWGWREEASGWIEWNWALLRGLYTWYMLPEDCACPPFVNEVAGSICIPDLKWADSLALLFQHPTSVLLGMEHMEVEKAAQEAAAKAKHEADALANAGRPLLKREGALAFLNEEADDQKESGDTVPRATPGASQINLPSITEVK